MQVCAKVGWGGIQGSFDGIVSFKMTGGSVKGIDSGLIVLF